jgi:pseudaminic acid synthase
MKTACFEKVLGGNGVYVIAEMSCNHQQDMRRAEQIVRAAKESGADALKVQTFTPDTITLDSANPDFTIKGTIWEGRKLHELYQGAYMPWEWHSHLKALATDLGMDFFSSPFDATAVDFLEEVGVPVYKVASFEVVDIPLLEKIAATGKPVIMSTGMATLAEIDEAVAVLRACGCPGLALLKCTSAYPAPFEEMNLRTIAHLSEAFGVPVGLSDHTLGIEVPVAAVALGARIVEKHLTLSRADGGPDSAFSLEPREFKAMVEAVRHTEKALGAVHYGVTGQQMAGKALRRSLYVVKDVKRGELFTQENVRSIRPGAGLHTRYLRQIVGGRASRDISRGTAMAWELVHFDA